jgi:hypothetical protein
MEGFFNLSVFSCQKKQVPRKKHLKTLFLVSSNQFISCVYGIILRTYNQLNQIRT